MAMPLRETPVAQAYRQRRIRGMTLTEGVHPAGSSLPWHDHAGPTLCFVLNGAFAEYMRGHTIDCRPSTFKITPAGERHWNRFDLGDVRGLLVELDPPARTGLDVFQRVLTHPHHSEGGMAGLLAHRLYAEFRADDEAADLAMEGVLLELLASVARSATATRDPAPGWAAQALALLQDAPGARHSLASIATEVNVHPATLARGFRRAYGCSIGAMQRRLRLEYAARQLETTTWPLTRIAQQAGFYDQSHFTNAFRKHLGRSPHQYRRAIGTPT